MGPFSKETNKVRFSAVESLQQKHAEQIKRI